MDSIIIIIIIILLYYYTTILLYYCITEVSSQYRGREDGRQGVAPSFGIVPGPKQFLVARFCYVTQCYTGLGTKTESVRGQKLEMDIILELGLSGIGSADLQG
jgi:Na+/alanine symporter